MKGNVHARMRRRRVILVSPFCKYFTRNLKKKKKRFYPRKDDNKFPFSNFILQNDTPNDSRYIIYKKKSYRSIRIRISTLDSTRSFESQ